MVKNLRVDKLLYIKLFQRHTYFLSDLTRSTKCESLSRSITIDILYSGWLLDREHFDRQINLELKTKKLK